MTVCRNNFIVRWRQPGDALIPRAGLWGGERPAPSARPHRVRTTLLLGTLLCIVGWLPAQKTPAPRGKLEAPRAERATVPPRNAGHRRPSCPQVRSSRTAFRYARPGYHWQFPRDHFAHPEFANEWWYFTGNLTAAEGRSYGFELTFFRISPFPGADLKQDFYFAHFAISDLAHGGFHFHERARRGLWQQAGIQTGSPGAFRLWTENWQLQMGAGGPERLSAVWGGMSLHLQLGPSPILFNGINGWSQKGAQLGESSYYYSLPRLTATGEIGVDGRQQPVRGLVWMDHEFATNQLAPNQQGWDWMGLQLQQPGKPARELDLMLFQLRQKDGSKDPHSSGTVRIAPPARVTALQSNDFQMTPLRWWKSPATGARYPVAWTVTIPSRQVTLIVAARQDNQELRTRITGVDYWEGAVQVTGKYAGHPVEGAGYLELTGYGHALRALQAR